MRGAIAAAAPWAVFLAMVGVLLGPSLSGAYVAVPDDLLSEFLPWSADPPPHAAAGVHNPELRDVVDQYYPGQHALLSRMRAGRAALWLPEVSNGYPGWWFIGWGALSPFNLPAAVLPFDLAWSWSMALRLLAAMGGGYVLARGFGLGRAGATVTGLAYGMCGYMVGWLGWPQSHVGAFLPWVLAAVRVCARPTRPPWAIAALAVATAGLWLGGFPSVALWGLVAAGVVALHALWTHRQAGWRASAGGLAVAGAGVAAGTALVAFTLLPTQEVLAQFDLTGREQMWRARVPLEALVTFVAPHYFGDVVNRGFWLRTAFVETVGYAGVVTLALALPAWLLSPRRPGVWLATGMTVGFTAVAYGLEAARQVISRLPLLSTNPPPRVLVLVGLSLALLGGFGADALVRWVAGRSRLSLATLLGAVVVAFAAVRAWRAARPVEWIAEVAADRLGDAEAVAEALQAGRAELLFAGGLVAAMAVLVVGSRLVAVPWRSLGAGVLGVGLVALVALDLGRFGAGWNTQVPRGAIFADAPGLDVLVDTSARHRVVGTDDVGLPNTHLEYGFHDLRAHGFVTRRRREVLNRMGAQFGAATQWNLRALRSADWEPWITMLGVRTVMTPDSAEILPAPLRAHPDDVPSGPVSAVDGLTTRVQAPRSGTLIGVQVRLGTFDRDNVGELEIRVRTSADPDDVATGEVPLSGLVDGGPTTIRVPATEVSAGQRVDIRFTPVPGDDDSAVAVFGIEDGVEEDGVVEPTVGLLYDDAPVYRGTDRGPVRLYDNPNAPPRVYAVGTARLVRPGRALDVLERMDPEDFATTAVVEPVGDAPVTGLPSGGTARVTDWSEQGGRIRARVRADDGAVLVALQEALDGWRATVDGRPADVVRANELFVGVVVPPGGGLVELRYAPAGLSTGMSITGATASLLCAMTIGASWRRRRRRRETAATISSTSAHSSAAADSPAATATTGGGHGDQASMESSPSA